VIATCYQSRFDYSITINVPLFLEVRDFMFFRRENT
jgi:hypothetical protein